MIVSHEYKFIFLKTRKTAGTSVEIALSRYCGPDDVITPIEPEDQLIREQAGARGPQNCTFPVRRYELRDWGRLLLKRRRRRDAYHHMTAAEVRQMVGKRVWDTYYKFSIERNPWDAVISAYYWRTSRGLEMTLSEFVRSEQVRHVAGNSSVYSIDGMVQADRVCRFEALREDLEAVRQAIGLPEQLDLPRAKAGTRSDRRDYHDALSPADADVVAELFAPTIASMGYRY
ncbi:sulfotransferase family 2 domain-containing protein [Georgenia alba]|uniref:Sulfotransferase family 2 domain-containing protein n=1 Tax=Georgenia alba TaxID=2233858 RepID=A0ABW2Q638_9MICO